MMKCQISKLKISALAVTLSILGCTTVPLDQRYTALQLAEQLRQKPRCEASVTNASAYTPDYERCAKDEQEREEQIRAALATRHAREIAAAPVCLREKKENPTTLRYFGLDPDSPDGAAELVSHGVFIGGSLSPQCVTQICTWLRSAEPDRDAKLWCQS
jgi:uncharacterized lipoprotein NlpE involved in copper resistance